MLVGLDIDGVIRNFVKAVRTKYKEVYPDHDVPVVTEWNISKIYPIGEEIYDFCFKKHTKEIFYDAEPYEGSKRFVNELSAKHEVVIITSQTTPDCKVFTMRWLADHGFLDMIKHVAMCGNGGGVFRKHMVKVDVLIDDRVKNLHLSEENGIHGIGPRRTWNDGRWDRLYDSYDEILYEVDRIASVLEKVKNRKTYKQPPVFKLC